MPDDLEQQLARFAEALDRDAPTISSDEVVGRAAVAVDVDPLDRPSSDPASGVNGSSWIDTTPSHDEVDEEELVELEPTVVTLRPAWRQAALKVAVGVAAVALLVFTLAAIERGGDDSDPADVPAPDFPNLTTTFVSPRNGFTVDYFDTGEGTVVPAEQLLGFSEQVDGGFDVVETGLAAVFKGASTEAPSDLPCLDADDEPIPCGSIDDQIDLFLPHVLPGGCGIPRSQQAEITIDGRSGRVAECPSRIEATVVFHGRLYLFTLSHDRRDARAVFDAFAATIDLTPETAVDFPAMTTTFVSPTYGYSFGYLDRGEGTLAPATELWDPGNQPIEDLNDDPRFDAVETGLLAYFESASTAIPDGVSIDAWVDEYVTPRAAGGCGVPRDQQAEIAIDGRPGRIAECDHSEATVVADGRLYLFIGPGSTPRNTAWFNAWIATVDLTPETAAVP
jgi:hypothetical protein